MKQHTLLCVLVSIALVGCSESPTGLESDAARGLPAHPAMAQSATSDAADDVVDALDRIAPAFGETAHANQLRAALRQLADAIRSGDDDATERSAGKVSQALDRLEVARDPGFGAEIEAIRFVADARS